MCVVSMVVGHGQGIWPGPQEWRQLPPQDFTHFLELVEKAKKYDELMKQKDCPDPQKEAWLKEFDEFMRKKYVLEPKP